MLQLLLARLTYHGIRQNVLEWTEKISYFRNFKLQIFDAAPKSQMFSKCTALNDKRSESCFTFEYLK